MLKLTRRQWLSLPLEMKAEAQNRRAVILQTPEGPLPVAVTFVRRVEDADYKLEVSEGH